MPVTDPAQPPVVALVGGGRLPAAVAELLDQRYRIEPLAAPDVGQLPAGTAAVLSVADGWATAAFPKIRRSCADQGVPWLPVWVELGRAVVGPLHRPDRPGCFRCLELRRRLARYQRAEHDAVPAQHAATLAERPSSWLTGLAADTIAALVADELAAALTDPDRAGTSLAAWYVELDTLTVGRHRFLPDPLCPDCSDLPDDSPELATIELAARPKLAPDVHRVRRIIDDLDELRDLYVDGESGLIRAINRDTRGGLVVAGAMLPLRFDSAVEPGIGRTRSYRQSEVIAILEALERHGGVEPSGKRTVVRGTRAELGDRALDPRTLGVHPSDSYARPGFAFRPFDDDQVCRWVWGWSFARAEPVLVPETCAYYYVYRGSGDDRPFVYEISNGCALGSCLEEAILYGMLEIAERDAFLMTWYGRLPVPRLDLAGAADPAIPIQAAAISAETGYEVLVFDTTMEHGIPSAWAMAVGPDDRSGPRMVCAAGAHFSMEKAVLNAISELGPILDDLIRRYPEEADRARRMVADPALVHTMQDHSLIYGAPEAFERLDFLVGSGRVRPIGERSAAEAAFRGPDLRDDLLEAVRRFGAAGMDVIVVDQTTPEHRAGGLACVKVLAPGSVPMTFGYDKRRIDGLPRLLEVPHRLGYRSGPLRPDELNPHPHPFP
jgi:ribosomal protein S12 methylthiotransferase accessory factor